MGASVINVYFRVVMPANGLRVNHYDFVALHSMWKISKGLIYLSTSGNYTHVRHVYNFHPY